MERIIAAAVNRRRWYGHLVWTLEPGGVQEQEVLTLRRARRLLPRRQKQLIACRFLLDSWPDPAKQGLDMI